MRYISTRDNAESVQAAEAIVRGMVPQGGLYVPQEIPKLDEAALGAMVDLSYQALAKEILALYLDDFSAEEISTMVDAAYDASRFDDAEVAPVVKIHDGLFALELWHGPTAAFKDMALQLLPHLLVHSMKKTGVDKEVVILVATSGDTGKAALEGFKDVDGTSIICFYPDGGVSEVQELQMLTTGGSNTYTFAVKGNFDDCQRAVKEAFANEALLAEVDALGCQFSSANSINWGRLLPQIVYYFSAYCDAVNGGMIAMGDKLNFVVPTGNFGDILAGWYAKRMGLPVGKLVCASNANNVLTDFIHTGTYDKNRPFHTTASPSMDILVSSNLERLLYSLCGSDTEVAGYMQQLREQGRYTVSDALLAKIRETFVGGCCNDIQTREKIGRAWRDHRYLIDTHTAVAYHVLDEYRRETGDAAPTVVVSTASPFKFCDQVLRGIGGTADAFGPELIRRLTCETQIDAPAPLTGLDARPVRFGGCVDRTQMLHTVDEFLK